MKFLSKLTLCLALLSQVHARDVIIFSFSKNSLSHQFVYDELMKKGVPDSLVRIEESDAPCSTPQKDAILHLCLDSDNELKVLASNNEVLKRSFRSFQ